MRVRGRSPVPLATAKGVCTPVGLDQEKVEYATAGRSHSPLGHCAGTGRPCPAGGYIGGWRNHSQRFPGSGFQVTIRDKRGRKMKLRYYPETDSLYIELNPQPSVDSRIVAEGVVADFDAAGNIVGIRSSPGQRLIPVSTSALLRTNECAFAKSRSNREPGSCFTRIRIAWCTRLVAGR